MNSYKIITAPDGNIIKIRENKRKRIYTIVIGKRKYKSFPFTVIGLLKTYHWTYCNWISYLNTNDCYEVKPLKRTSKKSLA